MIAFTYFNKMYQSFYKTLMDHPYEMLSIFLVFFVNIFDVCKPGTNLVILILSLFGCVFGSLLQLNLTSFILLFVKLIFTKNYETFKIKKLAMLFCLNLFKFVFFHFYNTPLLYSSFFLLYSFTWYGNFLNIEYSLGLDKLGFIFILLTLFLIPLSLLISWKSIYYNVKIYFLLFIVLEILLINVFLAVDLMLFYVAFESILIPMYFLIGYWGSRERRMHAAYQFFLFTLGGSLFMLLILIFCQLNFGSTNLHLLLNVFFSPFREIFIWIGIFIAFAVKIPMMPVHIWLPEAHVESATGGSVMLAGILLKLGTYGFLRFLIPLCQFGSIFFIPLVYVISFFGVFYASFTTLRQIDLKKIIAYSSVIHMNYLMFGLFAFNIEGLVGSLVLMVAHGFVSGGLFVSVGILYERYHTRLKKTYGGLNVVMPLFSIYFLIFTLANISFPGSINFLGEFLVLLGLFMKNFILGVFVIFLMIISTCYSLWLYNKVFSGLVNINVFQLRTLNCGLVFQKLRLSRYFLVNYTDLNLREFTILFFLIVPVVYLGLEPKLLFSSVEQEFSSLLSITQCISIKIT